MGRVTNSRLRLWQTVRHHLRHLKERVTLSPNGTQKRTERAHRITLAAVIQTSPLRAMVQSNSMPFGME